jgi:large subunit ribosomal protein L29
MKAKELKAKTKEELKKLLDETKESLYHFNLERVNRKLKNVSQIKKARHAIARILTILKEKEAETRNK